MKRISAKKEVLIIMMILVSLFTISSKVLATGTSNDPVQIPTLSDNEDQTQDPTTQEPTQPTQPTPTTSNETTDANQNDGNLPQTGDASDYAIFMLIIVAIVVAVYAYKKGKYYNI